MADYCTTAEVMENSDIDFQELNYKTEEEFYAYVGNLVTRASRMIDRYCRRPTNYFNGGATITEYQDGKPYPSSGLYVDSDRSDKAAVARRTYKLSQSPIVSVTSISDNSAAVGETAVWAAITNYHIDNDIGEVTFGWNASFSVSTKNLRFVYVAGYAAVPDEVKYACEDLVINALKKRLQENLTGHIKFGRITTSSMYQPDVLTKEIKEVLDAYKKVTI